MPVVKTRDAQGAAEGSAEVVEAQWWFTGCVCIREPIARVHSLVAKIFEQGARVTVCPRSRDHSDLRTRRMPELRREGRCLYPEFLQSIGRDQVAEGSEKVTGGNCRASCLETTRHI